MSIPLDPNVPLLSGSDTPPLKVPPIGSHGAFPPLSSSKKGGPSPSAKGVSFGTIGIDGLVPSSIDDTSSGHPNIDMNLEKGSDNGGRSSQDVNGNKKGEKNSQTMPPKGNRSSYANLFKNNRMAKTDFKLQRIESDSDMLDIGFVHIDSVDKTYGIFLLGYVISGKPPASALIDLLRRRGPNIQFQTHDSGWIVFTFPSIEVRSRILSGGS